VILERLPAILHRIARRVENNAVRVQVRIERARRIMREQGGGKVAGQTVALRSTNSNARCRERFKLSQRQSHGAIVCFKNAFIFAEESCNRNRLRR